jgi:hypothetical protein
VPGQHPPIRLPTDIIRHLDVSSVQGVVVASVLEFVLDPPADLEAPLGRDCHVPTVEQTVKVAPQQKPVGNLMRTTSGIGTHVRRIQRWESSFPSDRTSSVIAVRHQQPEGTLPGTSP